MDQAQWAQTEIALLPTEQIALRPSVQQKSLSHMPLETLAASMAREGLREPILVRAAAQGYIYDRGGQSAADGVPDAGVAGDSGAGAAQGRIGHDQRG